MEHKAHPTMYRGVQMRSRLEARWACVFDLIGLTWQYEPIELDGWIPDFLVGPRWSGDKRYLVEIKPIVSDSRPSDDVTNKIERALGAPLRKADRAGSPYRDHDWHAFFDALPYRPLILGSDPSASWGFQMHIGWWPVQVVADDWHGIWAQAGNATQWKSPRRA